MLSTILKTVWVLLKIVGCYFEALFRTIIPPKKKDISGKLVLVTGGRRGIGRALAFEFAKHGANIVLWDIDKAETEQTAEDIRQATGVKAKGYLCDVTDPNKVKVGAEEVKREMGKVDILVNNAGTSSCGDFLSRTEDEVLRTFNVNTLAHIWTMREFLPDMLERKEGHLFGTASVAAFIGAQDIGDYCAAKFALRGLYESMIQELKYNYDCPEIKVSVLCPGAVETRQLRWVMQKSNYQRREGDAVSPETVAEIAVDGLLRNQRIIFAPRAYSVVQYMTAFLPDRALDMVTNLMMPSKATEKQR